MTLFSDAIAFAAKVHEGEVRKGTDIPYIVHPMEAAAIAATLTCEEAVLAAAVLHDVIEDGGVTEQELEARFGSCVTQIVLAETQLMRGDPKESWNERKQESLRQIGEGDRMQRIVALGDKLSNMRAICRDYEQLGEALFFRFHQHDKRRHAWYYRSCAALLREELGNTAAWRELNSLIEYVFADCPRGACAGDEEACAV